MIDPRSIVRRWRVRFKRESLCNFISLPYVAFVKLT